MLLFSLYGVNLIWISVVGDIWYAWLLVWSLWNAWVGSMVRSCCESPWISVFLWVSHMLRMGLLVNACVSI